MADTGETIIFSNGQECIPVKVGIYGNLIACRFSLLSKLLSWSCRLQKALFEDLADALAPFSLEFLGFF